MEKPKLEFHVDIYGIKGIEKLFEDFLKYIEDPRPIFKKVLKDYTETEKKIFETEGSYEGRERWKKLSPVTEEIKKKQFPGKGMLIATGEIYDSLTDPFHPLMDAKITKKSIEIKSKRTDEKGESLVEKHRKGFKTKFTGGEGGMFEKVVNVPARDPASISEKQIERIVKIFNEEYKKEIRKLIDKVSKQGQDFQDSDIDYSSEKGVI